MPRMWKLRSALLTAIAFAALGAALAAALGWTGCPPLPSNEDATTLVLRDILPGSTVTAIERHDQVFFAPNAEADGRVATTVLGTDDIDAGFVELILRHTDARPKTIRSGRWSVQVEAVGDQSAVVTIERAEPAGVRSFSFIGYALGTIIGVLAWLWLGRSADIVARRLFLAGVLLLTPPAILVTGQLIYSYFVLPDLVTPPALWSPYGETGLRLLTLVAGLCFGMSLLRWVRGVAAGAGRAESDPRPAAPAPQVRQR